MRSWGMPPSRPQPSALSSARPPRPAPRPEGAPFRLTHWVRDAWEAVFADLRAARHAIAFEQYIVGDDPVGHALIDLCAEKARQGVDVRLLLDAIGCRELRASGYWRRVEEAGGAVRFYNALTARHLLRWPPVIHRDHRKTIVVDGGVAWVGGVCFQARMRDWRDSMVRLEGPEAAPTVAAVGEGFDVSWHRADALDRRVRGPDAVVAERGAPFGYLVNAPRPPLCRQLYETLLGQVRSAQHSLRLTTPYFVPDHRFLRELVAARARGLTVRLMVPAVSDHPPMDVLSRGFTLRMSRHGIDVRYFRGQMMHAKTAVIDDAWAFVGSLNLDRLSFRINLEAAVVSRRPDFVAALAEQVDRDLARCQTEVPPARFHPLADPLLRLAGRWI